MNKYHPKFLLSYVLFRSGFSHLFNFTRHGVKFNYQRSGLALHMFANDKYVIKDIELLNAHLNKDETFIDVGANIGVWTLYAAKLVGLKGMVLSFEPHPMFFKNLNDNIQLNNFKNIKTYNVGLSDVAGELYFSNSLDSMNHVLTKKEKDAIVVKVNTLDEYTRDLEIIDLIKVDIEGYELFCFKGAVETLKKTKKIIFESIETLTIAYGYSGSDIISFLNDLNFAVYKLDDVHLINKLDLNYKSGYNEDLIAVNNNFK